MHSSRKSIAGDAKSARQVVRGGYTVVLRGRARYLRKLQEEFEGNAEFELFLGEDESGPILTISATSSKKGSLVTLRV